jgi:hypothetical protein
MAVPIRTALVRDLISQRFGSVDSLVVEWEERVRSGRQAFGKARNRGTVYRWLDEGLPHRKDDILGFAGLLDVDPIALLDLSEDFLRRTYGRERRLFQLGALGRSRLAAFWALYIPGNGWPDNGLAQSVYGRDWTVRDQSHPADDLCNVYSSFVCQPHLPAGTTAPWVVHFAYRRAGARDGMWRPYGTAVRQADGALLVSENGDFATEPLPTPDSPVRVETHFGPGPAEFRLASLHPFDLIVTTPSPGGHSLRFVA